MESFKKAVNSHASAFILPIVLGVIGAFGIGYALNASHAQDHADFTYNKTTRGAISTLCRKEPAQPACAPSSNRHPSAKSTK